MFPDLAKRSIGLREPWNEQMAHSDLEMTLQVMKSSCKIPLTPGRWVHMGLKNDEIEIFCPCGYTKHFSKTKIAPFHSYQQSYLQLFDMYLNAIYLSSENIVTWNRQSYQWAIFNPEKSQKVPKRANFMISGMTICLFFIYIINPQMCLL